LTNIRPLELLDIAQQVASEAGRLAAAMRRAGVSVQATKSSQIDIVTQADTAVEALIRERLSKARPDDGILGEEGGEVPGSSGITWIVDPIDGTVNYLYGSPYYAVSIAATVRDERGKRTSVAGCVNAPALAAEYTAAAGHPAHLNGNLLQVNENVPLEKSLVSTAIPLDLAQRDRVLRDISTLTPRIRDFRLVGAASLEICGPAEGRTDAHIQRDLPIWDYAAAILIAAQAGADVRMRGGADRDARLELLLIANPQLADALDPLLA
jgi:myo-inositol-1(or 4)-monophosphatase